MRVLRKPDFLASFGWRLISVSTVSPCPLHKKVSEQRGNQVGTDLKGNFSGVGSGKAAARQHLMWLPAVLYMKKTVRYPDRNIHEVNVGLEISVRTEIDTVPLRCR